MWLKWYVRQEFFAAWIHNNFNRETSFQYAQHALDTIQFLILQLHAIPFSTTYKVPFHDRNNNVFCSSVCRRSSKLDLFSTNKFLRYKKKLQNQ